MARLERSVYLVVAALLAALCLLLLFRSNRALAERASAESTLRVQLSRAEADRLALEQEAGELKVQLQAAKAAPRVALTDGDLADLKAAGLQEPVADLARSLAERTDLLPAGSRLGSPQAWTITRRWVIAPFSNGAASGWLLLRYQVAGGQVEWALLDTD